jgi:hypothetical protein
MDTQAATAAQSANNPKRKVLLDDYIDEDEAAREIGCKPRTLRSIPDGPPYVILNKKRRYHIDGFRRWLGKRLKGAR